MGHLQYVLGVSFVVIFVWATTSTALKCYQCNSFKDKRCSDDNITKYRTALEQDCPSGNPPGTDLNTKYTLCRKIKQVIDFEVNGMQPESRIIRTCGWFDNSYKNRCYHRSGFGGRQEVCACDQDGCNSGSSLYASAALLFGLLAVRL